jgi:hypothetical protein
VEQSSDIASRFEANIEEQHALSHKRLEFSYEVWIGQVRIVSIPDDFVLRKTKSTPHEQRLLRTASGMSENDNELTIFMRETRTF